MPQFFIKENDINEQRAVIHGEDCHHLINVRRIKIGDLLRLRSESGKGYLARVLEIGKEEITSLILEETGSNQEPVNITLYMALIKGGNFEFVLQKAVEIGVNRIIPVISSRTVSDPSKKLEEKHARWSKIISSAAKQCLRSSMPEIFHPLSFSDAVKKDNSVMKLLAHPESVTELRDYLSSSVKPDSVSLLVGPEGGFSEAEILSAAGNGWIPVNFGSTHMRAETAAIILPSLVIYQWS